MASLIARMFSSKRRDDLDAECALTGGVLLSLRLHARTYIHIYMCTHAHMYIYTKKKNTHLHIHPFTNTRMHMHVLAQVLKYINHALVIEVRAILRTYISALPSPALSIYASHERLTTG